MKRILSLSAALILLSTGATPLQAALLYGATGQGTNGTLVILDPATGAVVTNVGALVDAGGNPYSITGLRFQPGTGVLYGSTGNASPTAPGHLVTINPATGRVTDIGALNNAPFQGSSDITFDRTSGTLYGNANGPGTVRLFTINKATGAATAVGPSGLTSTFGGMGLDEDAGGTLYFAGVNVFAGNHLWTWNKATGAATLVANLTGLGGLEPNALAFHNGTLYVSLTDHGGGNSLGTINTVTGAVTVIGPTVSNLDALAWQESLAAVPEPGSLAVVGIAALALLLRRRCSAPVPQPD